MMTSSDKAVYAVGWLAGFEAVLWTLVGERLADEMVARYAEIVEVLKSALPARSPTRDEVERMSSKRSQKITCHKNT